MTFTVAVIPDMTETVTAVKKGVIPVSTTAPPKTGQIWPRPAKNAANAG